MIFIIQLSPNIHSSIVLFLFGGATSGVGYDNISTIIIIYAENLILTIRLSILSLLLNNNIIVNSTGFYFNSLR